MDFSGFKLLLVFLAPSFGFGLWFVRLIVLDRRKAEQQRKAERNLVRALFAEIDFNTTDMEIFIDKSLSLPNLEKILKEHTKLVPHITDARHTEIYRTRITDVHEIADGMLHQIVHFYGLLEKIRVQIEGVNYPSYKTLTLKGRVNAVDVIMRTAQEAHECGLGLMCVMQSNHENLDLVRWDRRTENSSIEDLRCQMRDLERRLRSFHNKATK